VCTKLAPSAVSPPSLPRVTTWATWISMLFSTTTMMLRLIKSTIPEEATKLCLHIANIIVHSLISMMIRY
jgi:hypothetical protein